MWSAQNHTQVELAADTHTREDFPKTSKKTCILVWKQGILRTLLNTPYTRRAGRDTAHSIASLHERKFYIFLPRVDASIVDSQLPKGGGGGVSTTWSTTGQLDIWTTGYCDLGTSWIGHLVQECLNLLVF